MNVLRQRCFFLKTNRVYHFWCNFLRACPFRATNFGTLVDASPQIDSFASNNETIIVSATKISYKMASTICH